MKRQFVLDFILTLGFIFIVPLLKLLDIFYSRMASAKQRDSYWLPPSLQSLRCGKREGARWNKVFYLWHRHKCLFPLAGIAALLSLCFSAREKTSQISSTIYEMN